MRQYFLPAGLILAAIFALTLPNSGIFLAGHSGIKLTIIIIFLVSGYQTNIAGTPLNKVLLYVFLTAAAVSLLLAPLLGLAIGNLLALPSSLLIGLLIICAVPPTLSSGIVITGVSGGNMVLALMLTISLNLTGILTLPTVLHLCLKASGPVTLDQWALFTKMLLLVLLPFVLGKFLRIMVKKQQVSPNWSYVNSSCVILAVYISLAISRQEFFRTNAGQYLAVLFSVSLVHLLLLGINSQAAKLLKLNTEDSKALLFVASQKTLPVSLAVLAGLRQDTGNAVIVCLLFHFVQLLIDSVLASRFRIRGEEASKPQ
ncbi:solute carrier family 10 (sodium/bile acid cotransporter), member 7 [Candidatus Electrothrix aarhusensis]|uniref:Solute carrier family 10 (Sodium/bile acid cotransporter), member 7 n=1 Tax=Candidatus Electrothrix aarhusensis TaxID=1859131 RepID=A0A444J0N1_9BACT|nr:solute carrier family 10 (sodium/bile acid cotransporter), member 7 [Candidatus Electrothrix aarhusensis]